MKYPKQDTLLQLLNCSGRVYPANTSRSCHYEERSDEVISAVRQNCHAPVGARNDISWVEWLLRFKEE